MIRVENLEKSFHNKKILKGISCSFKKGETRVTKKVSEQIAFLVFFVIILGLIIYSVNDLLFR